MIDVNVIDRLRSRDNKVSAVFFYWVLYEAFDAKLRVVYEKIMNNLKSVTRRDRDT